MKKIIALLFALFPLTVSAQDMKHRYFFYDAKFMSPTSFSITDSAGHNKITLPALASAENTEIVFGNNATTAPVFTFRGNTSSADDDGQMQIYPMGAYSNSRGANLVLKGENVSAGGGDAILNSSGNIYLLGAASDSATTIKQGNASTYGAGIDVKHTYEVLTIAAGSGAAGVTTAGNLCASGLILGVAARVIQAPGGGATTFSIGCTGGGNLDQFIRTASTALNTSPKYPGNGDGTTTPWVEKSAATLTVTTDANVTGASMILRIAVYYLSTSAFNS